MSEQPLVSIIVPVYNSDKYLRRCIESILRQTYQNFELLLIDDGSTDNSGKICDEYALTDNRIRVFHKPNGGVSSARNYGLLRIRGKHLMFVDSDDWIDNIHLDTLMKGTISFDWIMIGMKFVDIYENIKDVREIEENILAKGYEKIDSICNKLPQFCWVTNKLYKSSLIREHGLSFIEKSHLHEDRIFNLHYLQYVNSLIMFSGATYNYHVENSASLTHSYVCPDMFLITAEEFDNILRCGKLGNNMSSYTVRFCIRFYIHTIGLCIVSPIIKLSLLKRTSLLASTLKSLLSSYAIHQYKLRVVKWGIEDFYIYTRKILKSKINKILMQNILLFTLLSLVSTYILMKIPFMKEHVL